MQKSCSSSDLVVDQGVGRPEEDADAGSGAYPTQRVLDTGVTTLVRQYFLSDQEEMVLFLTNGIPPRPPSR